MTNEFLVRIFLSCSTGLVIFLSLTFAAFNRQESKLQKITLVCALLLSLVCSGLISTSVAALAFNQILLYFKLG